MLFNSINFAIFLPIVFFLYWFVVNKNFRSQNVLLLVASYFFYACWDWRFLFLLAFSTALDYFTGLQMGHAGNVAKKKFWFWLSIIVNLGFLGFFKYYNFFAESFAALLGDFGFNVDMYVLRIILPVGISFYTFHGLSYVIDIYYDRIKPEKNFIDYSVFVAFFPLLVAGPIERATHLLPQIQRPRIFDKAKAVDGLRQILWGLFKKIVIADNCAEFANMIFNNSDAYSGSTLAMGPVFFAFQIYGDFSGYSDIALGTARLFGVELLQNFSYPYFARDISEFWRRWHISLSSWFRDYLYIPLGGSKGGMWMKVRNTIIIFVVSGFWHGAGWNYILWGFLNALFVLPLVIFNINRANIHIVAMGRTFPTMKELLQMLFTFFLMQFAWVLFRANSLAHAISYFKGIFTESFFTRPQFLPTYIFVLVAFFMFMEWIGREKKYPLENFAPNWPRWARWCFYFFLIAIILLYMGKEQEFIYFQF